MRRHVEGCRSARPRSNVRIRRERRGESDPLSHPARELEWIPVSHDPRGPRSRPRAGAHCFGRRAARDSLRPRSSRRSSSMWRPQRRSGLSIVKGSWSTRPISSPRLIEFCSCRSGSLSRARGRRLTGASTPGRQEPDDRPCRQRLAASGLPDDADGLAPPSVSEMLPTIGETTYVAVGPTFDAKVANRPAAERSHPPGPDRRAARTNQSPIDSCGSP